jgi:hypothetical protein
MSVIGDFSPTNDLRYFVELVQVLSTLMPNRLSRSIRCPYCRIGDEFRPMLNRVEGWLRCESCGHDAMPLDPEFRCACSNCDASQSRLFRTQVKDAD